MSGAARQLVVSLHDLHPGSLGAIAEQRRLLAEWGVARRSVLVVPQFHHGARFEEMGGEVRAWQGEGDEMVLHGYYHDLLDQGEKVANLFWTRLYTNGEAEFLDLSRAEARLRLERGRRELEKEGLEVRGFIAPAWLMASYLPVMLAEMGFAHTTTVSHFFSLKRGRTISSQSLCWSTRAAWRRACSLGWNRHLLGRSLENRLLRISLHPDDLTHVAIRKQIERSVKTALDAGFQAVTYAEYATHSAHATG
jgi:hypothetical protein